MLGTEKNTTVETLEEAVRIASAEAEEAAKAEARRRGVVGKIDIRTAVGHNTGRLKGNFEFDLGATVTATASGRVVS